MAGKKGAADLVIADKTTSAAPIVVTPKAGEWEARATRDPALYIERKSGAKVPVADTAAKALAGAGPALVVGRKALPRRARRSRRRRRRIRSCGPRPSP